VSGPGIPKEPVVEALVEEWQALAALLGGLTPGQWQSPTDLPGWTVADNVAHMIGTERVLMGDPAPPDDGAGADLPHIRNDIGALNERWVESYRGRDPEEVLGELRRVTEARAGALRAMSQADFDADSWTPAGPGTYGRFMQIRVFDCWMHEQDIRSALGRSGHDSGPCAEMSLDEVGRALGYIVGKKAGAPDGAVVTIEVTGGVNRQLHVAVDGRAAVVDTPPRPATVTVALPFGLFMRLAGGRVDPAAHQGEVTVTGDEELGRRVVASLPYTI
jgi:uncharacterized protein (TIGR03083 family)